MNADNMRLLADVIERAGPEHFGMAVWMGDGYDTVRADLWRDYAKGTPACGTVCCIGGAAEALANAGLIGPLTPAVVWLELDDTADEKSTLFYPNFIQGETRVPWCWGETEPDAEGYITHAHAVAMIRLCAERARVRREYWDESAPPDPRQEG